MSEWPDWVISILLWVSVPVACGLLVLLIQQTILIIRAQNAIERHLAKPRGDYWAEEGYERCRRLREKRIRAEEHDRRYRQELRGKEND